MTLEELQASFSSELHLTAKNELASLDFVALSDRGDGNYGIVVRRVCWHETYGGRSIRDSAEQDCPIKLPRAARSSAS